MISKEAAIRLVSYSQPANIPQDIDTQLQVTLHQGLDTQDEKNLLQRVSRYGSNTIDLV